VRESIEGLQWTVNGLGAGSAVDRRGAIGWSDGRRGDQGGPRCFRIWRMWIIRQAQRGQKKAVGGQCLYWTDLEFWEGCGVLGLRGLSCFLTMQSHLGVGMTQDFLDDARIHALFQEIGGVGMTKRMDGGPFMDAGFGQGFFEGHLDTGHGYGFMGGRLALPPAPGSGEEPVRIAMGLPHRWWSSPA